MSKSYYQQFYTLNDLSEKKFDGEVSLKTLLQTQPDFGIGTFNQVKGELILLNGDIYRSKKDGSLQKVLNLEEQTPYSITLRKGKPILKHLNHYDIEKLPNIIKSLSNDKIFGIEISGHFSKIKYRSPDQFKQPYPDLKTIISEQAVHSIDQGKGMIVGFYTPEEFKDFGVEGAHLHIAVDNNSKGGHLMEAIIDNALLKIYACDDLSFN